MLRLTTHTRPSGQTVLAAHGEIAADDLPLLVREMDRIGSTSKRLVLDLSQVNFIDPAGAELLRRWTATGLALQGGSLFVRELLRSYGLESDTAL